MTWPRRRERDRPLWLTLVTAAYLLWSLGPLVLAIAFSFNSASSTSRWEGFSLRWWIGDPAAKESILYDPETRAALAHSLLLASWTTLLAVPIGTGFALACGAGARSCRASG